MTYNYKGKIVTGYKATTTEITMKTDSNELLTVAYDDTLFFALWEAKSKDNKAKRQESTKSCLIDLLNKFALGPAFIKRPEKHSNMPKEKEYILVPVIRK